MHCRSKLIRSPIIEPKTTLSTGEKTKLFQFQLCFLLYLFLLNCFLPPSFHSSCVSLYSSAHPNRIFVCLVFIPRTWRLFTGLCWSDGMRRDRWSSALLVPGQFLLDGRWRGADLPKTGAGVRNFKVLASCLLLRWLRGSSHHSCCGCRPLPTGRNFQLAPYWSDTSRLIANEDPVPYASDSPNEDRVSYASDSQWRPRVLCLW